MVISAGILGKFKTVFQMIMSGLLIFHLDVPFLLVLEQVFIYASLVLTVMSLVDYMWKNKAVINQS
jgi:CDP-diacylglycerol--glycerol-3-phosphate 3-phosphatidyltransferase